MRAVTIALSIVLLAACARTGEEIVMTPPDATGRTDATRQTEMTAQAERTDPVAAASAGTAADAAAVATRELQTATFALG